MAALNLRTQALTHLTQAQGKKEHAMHALKRLELQTLRHHAPKGRKVLYAYTHPATGEPFEFITNELTLPPGLIAFVYLRRWDLEKVFDTLKNKLGADHAWASTTTAQQMQAQLLCLAHNLIALFERALAQEHKIANHAETRRRIKRLAQQQQQAQARGQKLPVLVQTHQRLTQTSLKLYRWLRAHYFSPLPLIDLLPPLARSYASL